MAYQRHFIPVNRPKRSRRDTACSAFSVWPRTINQLALSGMKKRPMVISMAGASAVAYIQRQASMLGSSTSTTAPTIIPHMAPIA